MCAKNARIRSEMAEGGPRRAYIWFARYLKVNQIPAIAVARKAQWLQEQLSEVGENIYQETKKSPAAHNSAISSAIPWGSGDIIKRLESADAYSKIPAPPREVLKKLSDLSRGARPEEQIFKRSREFNYAKPFVKALPFVELLADAPELEAISANGLSFLGKIQRIRTFCFPKLDRLNIHLALDYGSRLFPEMGVAEKIGHLRRLRQALRLEEGLQLLETELLEAMEQADFKSYKSFAFQKATILYESGHYHEFLNWREEAELKGVEGMPLLGYTFLAYLRVGEKVAAGNALIHLLKVSARKRFNLMRLLVEFCSLPEGPRRDLDVRRAFDELSSTGYSCDGIFFLSSVAVEVGDWEVAKSSYKLASDDEAVGEAERLSFEIYIEPSLAVRVQRLNKLFQEYDLEGVGDHVSDEPYGLFGALLEVNAPKNFGNIQARVSAIVTTFNALATVEYSVMSILQQSHPYIEVVIVDDGSDDGTWEYVRERFGGEPRVRSIRMTENSGPYACRNAALAVATGEFIAIQDANDVSHPLRFERQLEALTGDVKAVVARHIRVDARGRAKLENNGKVLGDGPMSLLFRREIIDIIGAFEEVRSRGDMEFLARLRSYFGENAIARVDAPLLLALHSPSSNSFTMTSSLMQRRELFDYRVKFARRHMGLRSSTANRISE